ncbi:MAG: alpha/beta hydrolase [Xanthobacteraceae bacterium]|nr:alpha/beta hydrolase [Xanthobacteraceae bacterium]
MLTVAHQLKESVPAPQRRFNVSLEDDATIRVRVYGNGPRLILSHGNGLAIDAYAPFWERLIPRYQVVVFDFRHHGLSSPYQGPRRNWPQFIGDFGRIIGAIDDELGPAPSVGVFHSMSALTALIHASENETNWRALVAFEPPTPPRLDHPESQPFIDMHRDLAEGAARRRESFARIEDLVMSLRRRHSFSRINDQTLYGLAAATLRWNPDRSVFDLACAREFESETFRLRNVGDAWGRVTSVKLPVCIVAGISALDENHCLANVARCVATDGGFQFRDVQDATHFLQLERPQKCAAIVEEFVAKVLVNTWG